MDSAARKLANSAVLAPGAQAGQTRAESRVSTGLHRLKLRLRS
jgi:hypothetical protein